MSQVYTINGQQGKFQIVNRGAKNHRVINIETQHSELVDVNLLTPLTNAQGPTNCRQKFLALEKLVKVVASGHSNGLFLCGPGGTGKTFTVMKVINELGLTEGVDYVVCKGYTTPNGLFQFLRDNSSMLVLFDDCDQVFKDQAGLNILKAVLDTYPQRTVSWQNSKQDEDSTFTFTGRIIFISNIDLESAQSAHLKAVLTRVLSVVLGSSREDVLMRLQDLVPVICGEHDEATQAEIRDFILENADHWASPSLRLLVHLTGIVKWAKETNNSWQDLCLAIEV